MDSDTTSTKQPACDSGSGQLTSRIARDVFVIPLEDDRYLVYAPLRRSAFVANAGMVDRIAELSTKPAPALSADVESLLRRLEILDAGPDSAPTSSYAGPPKPTTITLFLTTVCNLRCTYCYAAAGDLPQESMSLETAKRGIRFIVGNAVELGQPVCEIAYHGGGEPTTHWDVMVESLAFARSLAREHGIRVRAAVASNGVLSRAQVEWIRVQFPNRA